MIRTVRKEKLPKGFSYPVGAELLSAALDGIPQFDNAEIWFNWRDEFWVSRWRQRVESRGIVTLFEIAYSDYSGQWKIRVYSVPSQYASMAREHLAAELPRVRSEFTAMRPDSRLFRSTIKLSLSDAERRRVPISVRDKSSPGKRA